MRERTLIAAIFGGLEKCTCTVWGWLRMVGPSVGYRAAIKHKHRTYVCGNEHYIVQRKKKVTEEIHFKNIHLHVCIKESERYLLKR